MAKALEGERMALKSRWETFCLCLFWPAKTGSWLSTDVSFTNSHVPFWFFSSSLGLEICRSEFRIVVQDSDKFQDLSSFPEFLVLFLLNLFLQPQFTFWFNSTQKQFLPSNAIFSSILSFKSNPLRDRSMVDKSVNGWILDTSAGRSRAFLGLPAGHLVLNFRVVSHVWIQIDPTVI